MINVLFALVGFWMGGVGGAAVGLFLSLCVVSAIESLGD